MTKLVSVSRTPAGSQKKLIAHFSDGSRMQFGSKTSTTYAEGATLEKKEAYIARHKVNENWSRRSAGALARYVLWSKPSIQGGIAEYNRQVKG